MMSDDDMPELLPLAIITDEHGRPYKFRFEFEGTVYGFVSRVMADEAWMRLSGAKPCPYDGFPCYASAGTDDAHHRCGTSACKR